MLLNDNKEPIDENDIFRSDKLRSSGIRLLQKAMRGRVSYIRGETPDKFPIRLYPDPPKDYATNKITGEPITSNDYKFKFLQMYGSKLKNTQLEIYNEELQNVIDSKVGDNPTMTEDIRISQISNMTYPVDTKDIRDKNRKQGLEKMIKITREGE